MTGIEMTRVGSQGVPTNPHAQVKMNVIRESQLEKENEIEVFAAKNISRLRNWVATYLTYFWLHFLYFTALSLVGGAVIYGIERGEREYMDCLFTAVSACCVTGLITIDTSLLRTGSQVVVLLLIALGSQVLMSAVPIVIRRKYYREGLQLHIDNNPKAHRKLAEYRALGLVKRVSLGIYFGIHGFSFLFMGLYLSQVPSRRELCEKNNVNPWWFALFHSFSAFNNAGFSLFADNLIQFVDDYVVCLWTCVLILFGNTAYPLLFRFVIIQLHKLSPNDRAIKFLLKNPRRCSTHMFTAFHSAIILFCVISFTIGEFIAFLALDFNSPGLASLSGPVRALAGIFQSVSTRTAGFNVLDVSRLEPAVIVLYTVMMYVSSYPIIAAIRRVSEQDNVETATVETIDDEIGEAEPASGENPVSQVKAMLISDSWMMILALFAICAAEGRHIRSDVELNVFDILFELSSAYGTVGLSVGYPGTVTALSGVFGGFSKFVVILVMLAGRHRGQPRSIDQAVFIPNLLNVDAAPKSPRLGRFVLSTVDVTDKMTKSLSSSLIRSLSVPDIHTAASPSPSAPHPRSRVADRDIEALDIGAGPSAHDRAVVQPLSKLVPFQETPMSLISKAAQEMPPPSSPMYSSEPQPNVPQSPSSLQASSEVRSPSPSSSAGPRHRAASVDEHSPKPTRDDGMPELQKVPK